MISFYYYNKLLYSLQIFSFLLVFFSCFSFSTLFYLFKQNSFCAKNFDLFALKLQLKWLLIIIFAKSFAFFGMHNFRVVCRSVFILKYYVFYSRSCYFHHPLNILMTIIYKKNRFFLKILKFQKRSNFSGNFANHHLRSL